MSSNSYDKGDVVRLTSTYKNAAGVVVDPAAVLFKVQAPDGVITTYTYLTDAQLVKASTGVYYVDLTLAQSGRYHYRHYSTGSGAAAATGQLLSLQTAL